MKKGDVRYIVNKKEFVHIAQLSKPMECPSALIRYIEYLYLVWYN